MYHDLSILVHIMLYTNEIHQNHPCVFVQKNGHVVFRGTCAKLPLPPSDELRKATAALVQTAAVAHLGMDLTSCGFYQPYKLWDDFLEAFFHLPELALPL